MGTPDLVCRIDSRRQKLFGNKTWNGIDFLEVSEDQLSLCVHFFGGVPEGLGIPNVRVEGGRRIRDIVAVEVEIERASDPDLDDCLRIRLDKRGDFSIYRLCLVEAPCPADAQARTEEEEEAAAGSDRPRPLAGLDPRYASLDFSFKVHCPSDLDCKAEPLCPPPIYPAPEISYLAKDYASFRQLILDRLALTMPDWRERHVPDLGIALVEVLAYAADHLSYYQDAVATEAYLDTARLRISVRRHARLVDYFVHEGCNARAWVSVATGVDIPPISARDLFFVTGFDDLERTGRRIHRQDDLLRFPPQRYEVFEPLVPGAAGGDAEVRFYAANSRIEFYTWGDAECCLAAGATHASLRDPDRTLRLRAGDVLIFEEVLGPGTGNAADADPERRHAVRLVRVWENEDRLLDVTLLEVEWSAADALPFSLCLSARLPAPDCRRIDCISVALGNALLVDHGRSRKTTLGPVEAAETIGECACEGSVLERRVSPAPFTAEIPEAREIPEAPLTFVDPVAADAPATAAFVREPRRAQPSLLLVETTADGGDREGPRWTPRDDLLASSADDRHFVAEIDDEGRTHLRFGDGELGRRPAAGTFFEARFRLGNGPAGNVGRETIRHLVLRSGGIDVPGLAPRNPLPARGGTAPESTAEVKLFAPHTFRLGRLRRAITAADYAELAQQNAAVQCAAAELQWTGSWYEARVFIDPVGVGEAGPELLASIERTLYRYRRMGHDLAVRPAGYVPLDIALEVCVLPHVSRAQVRAALLDVLGAGRRADGGLGFFHPDCLSFGDDIHLSRIVAAVMAVEGVEIVRVTRLRRLHEPDEGALKTGVLPLGPMEIARLDNDPNAPENGELVLTLGGGR